MSGDVPNGLEGALRAAIAGNGSGGEGGSANDLVGLVMKVLPALLENTEEREDLVELQKESTEEIEKQLQFIRRQLKALVRSQKGLLQELALYREVQQAMLDQFARLQIIDLSDEDELEDDAYADELDDDLPQVARAAASKVKQRRNTETRGPMKKPRRRQ